MVLALGLTSENSVIPPSKGGTRLGRLLTDDHLNAQDKGAECRLL